jgi:hypothetical protein
VPRGLGSDAGAARVAFMFRPCLATMGGGGRSPSQMESHERPGLQERAAMIPVNTARSLAGMAAQASGATPLRSSRLRCSRPQGIAHLSPFTVASSAGGASAARASRQASELGSSHSGRERCGTVAAAKQSAAQPIASRHSCAGVSSPSASFAASAGAGGESAVEAGEAFGAAGAPWGAGLGPHPPRRAQTSKLAKTSGEEPRSGMRSIL